MVGLAGLLFGGALPTVGKDQYGYPASMVVDKANQRTVIARNVQSVGASETTSDPTTQPSHDNPNHLPTNKQIQTLEIKAIYSKAGKTLALGHGTFNDKSTRDVVYTNATGNWVCGVSPVSEVPRPNGIAYYGGNFVVATKSKTIVSDFKYIPNTLVSGGIVLTYPKSSTAALGGATIDNLSASSSLIVAGSTTSSGTWITNSLLPANEWGRHVGQQELKLTSVKSTSYTFPGYAGANPQIQRAIALPNGDAPPLDWTTGDERTNGYYGVIGGPVMTTTWVNK